MTKFFGWTSAFFVAGILAAAAQTNNIPAMDAAKAGIGTYDIRDFGAVGDGWTINTKAMQGAIDACAANHGGTVLVPAGEFRTGTLQLKSDVTLHLAPAGRILGSTNRV